MKGKKELFILRRRFGWDETSVDNARIEMLNGNWVIL